MNEQKGKCKKKNVLWYTYKESVREYFSFLRKMFIDFLSEIVVLGKYNKDFWPALMNGIATIGKTMAHACMHACVASIIFWGTEKKKFTIRNVIQNYMCLLSVYYAYPVYLSLIHI